MCIETTKLFGDQKFHVIPLTKSSIFLYNRVKLENKGCGRTFSVLFSHILPRHSTRSRHLKDFFNTLLNFSNVHAAWYHSSVPFSIRTAYNWLKKLKNSQAIIRSNMRTAPRNHLEKTLEPHLETISLIRKQSQLSDDYIADYQQRYQTAFFFPKSPAQPS